MLMSVYALIPLQISLPDTTVLTTIATPTTSSPSPNHPRNAPGINRSQPSTTTRFNAVADHLFLAGLLLPLPLISRRAYAVDTNVHKPPARDSDRP